MSASSYREIDPFDYHTLTLTDEERKKYEWSMNNQCVRSALKYVFKGRLNEESPRVRQPEGFKDIELKPHQLATIYAMHELESSPYRYFPEMNVGVLADSVGSGKSYNVLGHLLAHPLVENTWGNSTRSVYHPRFVGLEYTANKEIPANLLVVSHSIFNQWKDYLSHTTLKVKEIGRKSDFKGSPEEFIRSIEENEINVVLMKGSMWNHFVDYLYYDEEEERIINQENISNFARNIELVHILEQEESYPDEFKSKLSSNLRKMSELLNELVRNSPVTSQISTISNEYTTICQVLDKVDRISGKIRRAPREHNVENLIERLRTEERGFMIELVRNRHSKYVWNRIIVDEVDMIKISSARYMYGKFMWFITNNIENLVFPRRMDYHESTIMNSIHHETAETKTYIPQDASGFGTRGFFYDIWYEKPWIRYYPQIKEVFIRNERDFVEQSFLHEIMPPIYLRYWLRSPEEMRVVRGLVGEDVLEQLQAGNWTGAVRALNDRAVQVVATREDFLRHIRDHFMIQLEHHQEKKEYFEKKVQETNAKIEYWERQIQRVEIELEEIDRVAAPDEYELKLRDLNDKRFHRSTQNTRKEEYEMHVRTHTEQVEQYERQVSCIQDRVKEQLRTSHCPICLDELQQPIGCVPCCNHTFCMECLMHCLQSKQRCPLCRSPVRIEECPVLEERLQERKEAREEESGASRSSREEIVLPAFPDESEGRHLMREHRLDYDKVKVLRALLTRLMNNENQSAKVLIFSEYDQSFETDIIPWMEEQNIQFEVLGGNSGAVESKIRRYKNGSTKVLLLNARHFGSGLNLQMTTDLVLYHRMANPLERQVLGRAQRFGRTQALRVHSLLYDDLETPSNIYTH